MKYPSRKKLSRRRHLYLSENSYIKKLNLPSLLVELEHKNQKYKRRKKSLHLTFSRMKLSSCQNLYKFRSNIDGFLVLPIG